MATNNADNFNNPIGVANGGTGVASFTTYAPLAGGTSTTGALQQATSGMSTSGNILKSSGASALPTWLNFSLTKLNSQTVSGASTVNFDNTLITSTYSHYLLTYQGFIISTTNANAQLTVSTDNGSTFLATGYQSGTLENSYNSTVFGNANATINCLLAQGIGLTTAKTSGEVFLSIPQSNKFSFVSRASYGSGTSASAVKAYGNNSSTTTINYIRISTSAGTITGTFSLYGIKS